MSQAKEFGQRWTKANPRTVILAHDNKMQLKRDLKTLIYHLTVIYSSMQVSYLYL